jgi:hypothetical protein
VSTVLKRLRARGALEHGEERRWPPAYRLSATARRLADDLEIRAEDEFSVLEPALDGAGLPGAARGGRVPESLGDSQPSMADKGPSIPDNRPNIPDNRPNIPDNGPPMPDSGSATSASGSEHAGLPEAALALGYPEDVLARLWEAARPIREQVRLDVERRTLALVALCRITPLSVQELVVLTRRSEKLVGVVLGELLAAGRLRHLHPDRPRHPGQRYLAGDGADEA